jgi:hypothetical protein
MAPDPASPALSIAIATRQGWPGIEPCLASVLPEADAVDGEVIVADGSGREPPPSSYGLGRLVWLSKPDASVFQLSRLGLDHAKGPLVAVTEDHCVVHRGWARSILDAHAEHPEADAVGGAIENGSTDTAIDWASYYITQGPFQGPLPKGPARRIATEANLSFKRPALDGLSDRDGMGYIVLLHLIELHRRGAILVNDDRLVVDHFQSVSFAETSWIHFHNGRTIAAFRRPRMTRNEWLRMGALGLLPWYRAARVVRIGFSKRRLRRQLVGAIPGILWLEACHAAGELLGYVAGAGDSPKVLR